MAKYRSSSARKMASLSGKRWYTLPVDRPAAEATSSAEWLYVIDVQRSERVAEVLTRLPMFESSKLGAYDMLLQRTGGVGLAVGRGVIVAASSERQLRRWRELWPWCQEEVQGAVLSSSGASLAPG